MEFEAFAMEVLHVMEDDVPMKLNFMTLVGFHILVYAWNNFASQVKPC